ncbi:MAG: LamG-like jellyroll fold domain-containing protein [Phycisphaerales bacterium]
MGKRLTTLILCALAMSAVAGSLAYAGDPTLIGWWKLNDGTGTTALDLSGYGHNGAIKNPTGGLGTGGSVWVNDPERGMVIGFNGTDGSGAFVDPSLTLPAMTLQNDFTWMFWAKQPAAQATNNDLIMGNRYGGTSSPLQFIKFTPTRFECYNDDSSYVNGINYNSIPSDVWVHHVLVKDGASLTYYRNGAVTLTNTMTKTVAPNPFYMGADGFSGTQENWQGYLSDVRLYERALTASEVAKAMAGKGPGAELAGDPIPQDEAKDVPQDAGLSWTPGETAATHDVYLGTSFEDVNAAGRTDSKGVLVSQDQAALSYDAEGLFEFGKVYYWRVDEVNAAPDNAVFKGEVWSFTAEPFSYPIENIVATASSQSRADSGPQNTVNGSGLNAEDQHSVNLADMWLSTNVKPHWIQYQFDKVYKLDELWVWNANQIVEAFVGFGAKDVTIEYSLDGQTWTTLEGVPEFARATADSAYTANTVVDFGGVEAKFVKLTINSNWGGVAQQTSLSEVRFFSVPVQAREPVPADAATDVDLTASLNWRPGREATSHKVFFGADSAAVAAGAASAGTVTDRAFTPAPMTFGTKYFWKVDEVGDAGTYAGDIWSFTAQEFASLDDFESYTDDEGSRIYEFWLDGIADTAFGGSTVGYMTAPFAERAVIHSGKQAMPLAYDNSKAPFFSEAVKEFESPQNCTGSGATELCVWTRGYPALATTTVTETGGKMSLTGSGADIWNNSDEFTYAYKTLTGDGSMIARVTSIGPGANTWAKGGVMIRDTVNGGSMHAMMIMTANTDGAAGNGASFQYRATTNGGSANTDSSVAIKAPYWVKIERAGSTLSGSTSADGKTWTLMSQAVIEMTDPVLIGVCVTSHQAGEERTYQFEGIAATGNVTGAWQGAVINAAQYNDAAPMYLTVTDSAGKSATATSDTAATVADWTRWTIPMNSLSGVSLSKVKKLTIGVGAKNATTGGSGMVFIDDIGFGRSAGGQ